MNKKFTHSLAKLGITIIIMIIILVIGSTSSSYATSSDDSGYNTLKLVNNLNFKANLNNGLVYLSWSRYVPPGFNYYKVIRSTTNSNPVYPEDGYIHYSDNDNSLSYIDTKVPKGIAYYRVCSIAKPERFCSNVIKINNGNSDDVSTKSATKKKEIKDINSHTYRESIEYLLSTNIVQGYSDGTFKPDIQVNRAEFTKMIIGAKYSKYAYKNEYNCFKDVKKDWYAPYVCYAKKKGILNGYLDGTFKPAKTINFAEAAKIIVNTFGTSVKGGGVWYKPYVVQLSDKKVIPTTIADFNYKITRGEIAEMLWRLKEKVTYKEYSKYDTNSAKLSKQSSSGSSNSSSASSSSTTSSGGGTSTSSSSGSSNSAGSSMSSSSGGVPVIFVPTGGGGGGGGTSSSSTSSSSGAGSGSSSSSSGSSSTSSSGGDSSSSSTSSGGSSSSSTSSGGSSSSSTSSGGGDSSSSSTSSGGSSSSSTSSGGSSSSSSGGGSIHGTYYVRTDGGDETECNGTSNTAYSGSGTNQNCAWKHPFVALPPDGSARIVGGNTLIIANGSYKMGYGASAGATANSCDTNWSYECMMQAIPSGPSSSQPTKILGEGYNSGCSTKPELWGSQRPWAIINMDGSSNVEVQCLEITDHSQCVESHSGSITCERNTYPYGDWASIGLRASDSSNVLLKNLDIHGLAHTGIHAGRLTDWTIENTKIEGNGWVGWDGDIDGTDANTGTMTFKKVNIDWNGCGQTYPERQPVGCWGQTAGGYGDGFGTGDTGGDWIFEDSTFLHNTSDGLDMLYHRSGGSITIKRVHAEGNAGNQIKTTGNTQITDSVVVGDCAYFQGKPFTHNVDNCRALGTAVSLTANNSSPMLFYNNSVYGEGDGLLYADGTGTVKLRNNIFYADTDYLQPFEKSFYLYTEGSITFDQDYNLAYQAKDSGEYCAAGSNNICSSDPQFQSVNSGSFDLQLKATSPAIDAGTTAITSTDYLKGTRPQGSGVDMGAYEY